MEWSRKNVGGQIKENIHHTQDSALSIQMLYQVYYMTTFMGLARSHMFAYV